MDVGSNENGLTFSGNSSMFRYLNLLMILVFLLSVAVQYNDPDGLLWMAVYGVAAGFSIAFVFQRLRWQLPVAMAIACALWAVMLYPRFAGRVTPAELITDLTMKTAAVEYAREAGGLLIVVGWMIVVALKSRKREFLIHAAEAE